MEGGGPDAPNRLCTKGVGLSPPSSSSSPTPHHPSPPPGAGVGVGVGGGATDAPNIIIIHTFYIALFSALEQTHCAHWHVILNE